MHYLSYSEVRCIEQELERISLVGVVIYLTNQSVPPQPRQVQVRLCVRADYEPDELPLGPEGLQGLLWR